MQSEKSFPITCILCFLFGIWGIHRFYVGKFITAILMVLTFGGLGVWTLIDFIRIVTGNFKDGSGLVIKSGGKLASQATGSSSTTPAKSKSLLIWVALGSILFLVLVIVVVVAIPGEDEAGTPVAYQTPEQAVRSAIVEALGKSNREVPGGSSNARQVQKVAFNDGVITVQWTINGNLSSGMRIRGAKMDVIKILKAVQGSSISYKSILVEGTFPLVDKYGNASERQVVTAPYDRSTVDKINWDNFLTNNVFQIADGEFGALLHKDFRD